MVIEVEIGAEEEEETVEVEVEAVGEEAQVVEVDQEEDPRSSFNPIDCLVCTLQEGPRTPWSLKI